MALLTLLDLVTLQLNDRLSGLIEDQTQYSPEFAQIPVTTRAGTFYRVVRRTSLPTGGFRQANNGQTPGKSAFKQEVKEMFFLDFLLNLDEAIFKADDRSTGDILTHEMNGVLQAALNYVASQTWYGTANDAEGFPGIRAQLAGSIGAGATGANTTSAYLLWLNPQGISFDVGQDGQMACPPPMRQQLAVPSPGTGSAFYWVTNLSMYIGLAVKSAYSAWAVTGINNTVATSKYTNALTDSVAAQLLTSIPVVRRQGLVWFMNRLGYGSLQTSRTAINQQVAGSGGQPAWSPRPTECEGYPIVVSEGILTTENN